jgi:hypothetical protein
MKSLSQTRIPWHLTLFEPCFTGHLSSQSCTILNGVAVHSTAFYGEHRRVKNFECGSSYCLKPRGACAFRGTKLHTKEREQEHTRANSWRLRYLTEGCREAWCRRQRGLRGARSDAVPRPSSGPSGAGHPAPGGRGSSPSAAWTATPAQYNNRFRWRMFVCSFLWKV